ncbi:hypothetical protein GcC1_061036 [Golovinomyces cichoracearum]|uniref:Uncharacterized protein n=1 Tax=Golovinomyces cichoracearum TaxID=62708 RepID=A0A420ITB1_9PEZI|nr:hypothetical protein GcC1_061036 [Golovinomyces cichoracearum]
MGVVAGHSPLGDGPQMAYHNTIRPSPPNLDQDVNRYPDSATEWPPHKCPSISFSRWRPIKGQPL